MSNESLDIQIVDLIKKRKGWMRVEQLKLMFDNYSKGYLFDRIQVLKKNGLILEENEIYYLTEKGYK